ncbi:MAG: hypothetical protein R3198_12710 [Marinobacter sp.]|nr:hypothetical protein [Marinobacter sp.]
MKKLHSLAFYALITPAIALGSAVSLAEEGSNGDKDLGEQDMDQHAEPEDQNSELHEESKKSKYNTDDATGTDESETDAQSGKQKKEEHKTPSDKGMTE